VGYIRYMTLFFVVKSTSHETNGARQNRLNGRQKWLEPTWNVQVDLKSTSQAYTLSFLWSLLSTHGVIDRLYHRCKEAFFAFFFNFCHVFTFL